MRHFDQTTYGYGRFNGTLLSLTDGGLSTLYEAHPNFERFTLHSDYEGTYRGETPEGKKFEYLVPDDGWKIINKAHIVAGAGEKTYSYLIEFETGSFNAEVFCQNVDGKYIFGNILRLDFTRIHNVEIVPAPKIPAEILEKSNRILVLYEDDILEPEIFDDEFL